MRTYKQTGRAAKTPSPYAQHLSVLAHARAKAMYSMYLATGNTKSVALEYQVSARRIHQIFKRYGMKLVY